MNGRAAIRATNDWRDSVFERVIVSVPYAGTAISAVHELHIEKL